MRTTLLIATILVLILCLSQTWQLYVAVRGRLSSRSQQYLFMIATSCLNTMSLFLFFWQILLEFSLLGLDGKLRPNLVPYRTEGHVYVARMSYLGVAIVHNVLSIASITILVFMTIERYNRVAYITRSWFMQAAKIFTIFISLIYAVIFVVADVMHADATARRDQTLDLAVVALCYIFGAWMSILDFMFNLKLVLMALKDNLSTKPSSNNSVRTRERLKLIFTLSFNTALDLTSLLFLTMPLKFDIARLFFFSPRFGTLVYTLHICLSLFLLNLLLSAIKTVQDNEVSINKISSDKNELNQAKNISTTHTSDSHIPGNSSGERHSKDLSLAYSTATLDYSNVTYSLDLVTFEDASRVRGCMSSTDRVTTLEETDRSKTNETSDTYGGSSRDIESFARNL